MFVEPRYFDVPMPALSAAALALFFAKTVKTFLLYPQKVRSGLRGAVMASVAGLALTHAVGKAVLSGLVSSGKPFLRTPKCEDPALFSQALRSVWQETTLLGLCGLAVLSMVLTNGLEDPAATLWMVMLAVQSLPYAATVATAALSALSNAKRESAAVVALPPLPTGPAPEPSSMAKAA
jgi:hypothetical protein